jgi:hypothetical protein
MAFRRLQADQVEQGRHHVAGMGEAVRSSPRAAQPAGQEITSGSRMPPPWVFCL